MSFSHCFEEWLWRMRVWAWRLTRVGIQDSFHRGATSISFKDRSSRTQPSDNFATTPILL